MKSLNNTNSFITRYHIFNILIFNILYNIGSNFSSSYGYALTGSIMVNVMAYFMNLVIVNGIKKLEIVRNFIFNLIIFFIFIFTLDLSYSFVDQSSIIKTFNFIEQGENSFRLYVAFISSVSGIISFFISLVVRSIR